MVRKRMTKAEEELTLLSWFVDLAENGDLKPFLEHINFDMATVPTGATSEQFFEAFKQHYLHRGRIDEYRIALDLLVFPPIAAEIVAQQIARDAAGKS